MGHTTSISVRYAETDQMQVVYYAHYFVWMEQARTEYLNRLGFPYHLLEKDGLFLPVLEAHARYHSPARYGDEVEVHSRFHLQGVRIRVDYRICRGDKLLADGHTLHVFANRSGKPMRPPKELREALVKG